jgi:hypothetical protein
MDNSMTPAITTELAPTVEPTRVQGRVVSVRLAPLAGDPDCNFWVGLAAEGQQSPTALMDVDEMGALFADAATKGIAESGPVMLSDTSVNPPRYVYLLPVPELDFRSRTLWIQDLVASLSAWAPKSAGIYLAPQLVQNPSVHELLSEMLTALIQASATEEYVLLTGAYGLNAVLNVALRLKADLDGEQLTLAVYH